MAGPESVHVCAVWLLGRLAMGGLWHSLGRDIPARDVDCPGVGSHGGRDLQDAKGWCALALVCREVSALPPADCTGLSSWEVAFPKDISHPGVKRVPGKRGHIT